MFLDTTFCIDLMREHHRHERGPATNKLADLGDTELYISLFVACELHAGARMAKEPQRELRKVAWLLERVASIHPDSTFAVAYGETEAFLRREGKPIPTMDLLIGVMAKMHGLPILTRDREHYAQIPGLVVETY